MDEKKILVAGAGKSGIGAIRLLTQAGKSVILYDGNAKLTEEEFRARSGLTMPFETSFGSLPEDVAAQCEYCVISPGISVEAPFAVELQKAGVPVISEIELAYRFGKGKIAAITGTNGKTTTTALVGQIFAENCSSAFTVGNIGIPYTEKALEMREDSYTAAEVSSFQLETTHSFHPEVSAILNITPDHLDRHHTMENYALVKEMVCKNQTPEDTCVLNYDDEVLRTFGSSLQNKVSVVWFSSRQILKEGFYLADGAIVYAQEGRTEEIMKVDDLQIIGRHNYENAMAAIAIAKAIGIPMAQIVATCKRFKAVEHRIEFVAKKQGVTYYNDSKGTNTDAAIQAIRAMTAPTILIGGGYDKGSEFDDWIQAFEGKVKLLLLMGQTREKIAAAAEKYGVTDYLFVDSMEEAVEKAAAAAKDGEMVLLSPACASWGMFKNYEQRGDIFKELVRNLPD